MPQAIAARMSERLTPTAQARPASIRRSGMMNLSIRQGPPPGAEAQAMVAERAFRSKRSTCRFRPRPALHGDAHRVSHRLLHQGQLILYCLKLHAEEIRVLLDAGVQRLVIPHQRFCLA